MIRSDTHRATSSYDGRRTAWGERDTSCYTSRSVYDIQYEMYGRDDTAIEVRG